MRRNAMPATPTETAEQRVRAVNMIANGHTYEAVAELMARACPAPTLHQVEGAPIQKLADLLRTATELDEIADAMILTDQEFAAVNALRAAVRALNGGAS